MEAVALYIREAFTLITILRVLMDGKHLSDLTGNDEVYKLPIPVTGNTKLLAFPKIHNESGQSMTKTIHDAIADWKLTAMFSTGCLMQLLSMQANLFMLVLFPNSY
jgi:hypothetical protein